MVFLVEMTGATSNDDVFVEFDNKDDALIYIAQNGYTDDGYRVIKYYEGTGEELRSGSKVQLRTYVEDSANNTDTNYDTRELADTAIAALDDSDGYDMIDLEQPVGSAPSLIIEARPSLWRRDDELLDNAETVASRENGYSRTELDRF